MATRPTPGTRAKDSDRTDTCRILDSALADGQLSMEEHRQRVSAATNAATLGELASLVTDLQTADPGQPPPKRGPRALIAAAAGVLVVCGLVVLGVGWLALRGTDSPASTAASTTSAAPEPHAMAAAPTTPTAAPEEPAPVVVTAPRELQSADGLARVLDEMRTRFGDTLGYELAITSDDAMLARPDPADGDSKLIYSFDGGWGDPSTRPRSDTDDVTDLAAFDVPAVAAALASAPDTLRVPPTDVAKTFVDIDHVAEPPGPGALELLVKVTTTAGGNGWIYLDGAGEIKRVEYPS